MQFLVLFVICNWTIPVVCPLLPCSWRVNTSFVVISCFVPFVTIVLSLVAVFLQSLPSSFGSRRLIRMHQIFRLGIPTMQQRNSGLASEFFGVTWKTFMTCLGHQIPWILFQDLLTILPLYGMFIKVFEKL